MPGVVVTTAVRTGPSTDTVNPSSAYFVVGTAERGPIDRAVQVNSIVDFEVYYGEYNAAKTLHQQVQTFFEEGGSRAYISRVVGASATTGSLSAFNSEVTFTAANPGSWSENLSVVIVATGGAHKAQLLLNDEIVYTSPLVTTRGQLASAINTSPTASAYIVATVEASPELPLGPLALSPLSAGADGEDPSEAELLDGLDLFEASLGAGAVAVPGLYTTTAYDALLAHAVATNRLALLAVDPAITTANGAIDELKTYIAGLEKGEYGALYFPHVNIVNSTGTPLTISPESYVAAKRALAHNETGAWAVGAGLQSQANFVTGVAVAVDKTAGALLDEAKINAIRVIQNSVRIYGARSLCADEINFRFINGRDMLNYIVSEAEKRLEDLVFAPIDGRRTVFGSVEATLIALLDPLRTAGGLFEAFDAEGNQIDSGYTVEVSDALNPLAQLADGVVRAKVGVRISGISDRIEINIVKSNLTSSVV